jgi:hypothetical protein
MAFSFPCVNGGAGSWAYRLRALSFDPGGILPRRFCSARTTESNWSSSSSLSCLVASGRLLGRMCRWVKAAVASDDGDADEADRATEFENKSGVAERLWTDPIPT